MAMALELEEVVSRRLRDLQQLHSNSIHMKEIDDPRHGRVSVTEHVYQLVLKDRREKCAQRTPQWFAKRQNHITASQMASICNANPYETRSSTLRRKLGVEKPFKGNTATEHGNKYELEAILLYEQVTGAKCLEFGLLESLNENEEYLAGSPDGITTDGRLIEVKCPLRRTPTQEIPSYYRYQIQFLMHILRLRECDFIQYVPGGVWVTKTFIVTREEYNPYFWYAKEQTLRSFWDEVLRIRAMQNNNVIEEERVDEEEEEEEDESAEGPADRKARQPLVINIDIAQRRPPRKQECLIALGQRGSSEWTETDLFLPKQSKDLPPPSSPSPPSSPPLPFLICHTNPTK